MRKEKRITNFFKQKMNSFIHIKGNGRSYFTLKEKKNYLYARKIKKIRSH